MKEKLEKLRQMTKRVEKLGGMGASDIGSPDWQVKMQRHRKMQEFGNVNDMVNRMIYHKNPNGDTGKSEYDAASNIHSASNSEIYGGGSPSPMRGFNQRRMSSNLQNHGATIIKNRAHNRNFTSN